MTTETPLTRRIRAGAEPPELAAYERSGGLQGLRRALAMTPAEVTAIVKEANLRGRGGAGFSAGLKWSLVPGVQDAARPRYVVVNGDEMEPGTFKDRLLMEGDPLQLVEGAVIAAYAIQADVAYVFVRREYVLAAERLRRAIAQAYAGRVLGEGILGSGYALQMHLHVSAGRYMCGEETGLLNSLEGRRANPRTKPPFPPVVGLWGKPTLVNNVETLCNVPHILERGAAWYLSLSRTRNGGTKLYGASGKVKRPGLWELPMGTTVRELLDRAGGMRDGLAFRGCLPGGASTDFLTDAHLDVELDFDAVPKAGSRLGTGTMIVLDDRTCPVGMLENLEHFFAQESCGWCTPCWSGLHWCERILGAIERGEGRPDDLSTLELQTRMNAPGRTFCALAPGAVEPLQSALRLFREDFDRHLRERRCPWR